MGLRVSGNHCRFFNIPLSNIEADSRPPEFCECIELSMCDTDLEGQVDEPTDPGTGPKRYTSQARQLVEPIEESIRAVSELRPRRHRWVFHGSSPPVHSAR